MTTFRGSGWGGRFTLSVKYEIRVFALVGSRRAVKTGVGLNQGGLMRRFARFFMPEAGHDFRHVLPCYNAQDSPYGLP
jgi:hypothetical protein